MVLNIFEYDIIDQYHFHPLKKNIYITIEKQRMCLPKSACPVASSAMIPEKNKKTFIIKENELHTSTCPYINGFSIR